MNVHIKRIGNAAGTVGWLHAGLQAGTLQLVETLRSTDRHHGLWLKSTDGKLAIAIAMYDYHAVGDQRPSENKYRSLRNQDARPVGLTDATWFALLDIGDDWACMCNEEEEHAREQVPVLKVVRVNEQTTA